MAKDLAKINLVRTERGLPPLDKLPDEPIGEGTTGEATPPNPPGAPIEPPPPPDPEGNAGNGKGKPDPNAEKELDDAAILAALKRKGIAVDNIGDLLPKPDPAQVAEKREAAKLSYALSKGLFSTKEHERYIREKNNPKDLVFSEYYAEAKKDDPELSDEDIQAEFEEKYGLSADPGTRKYKRGESEIGLLADKILRDRYKNIYSADDNFTKFESEENAKNTRSQTILSKAPTYKKDVEEVFNTLKKIKLPIGADEFYEVEVPEDALNTCKELFLDPDTAAEQILGGYTADKIREVAYTALLRENLGKLFHEGAKQYHLKRQAGAKGIPPVGPQRRTTTRVLTEDQKRVLADAGIKEDDLPPINEN